MHLKRDFTVTSVQGCGIKLTAPLLLVKELIEDTLKLFLCSIRSSLSLCSLYSPSMWTVYLGKLMLNRGSPTEEVARVQRIHLHHYYDDDTHDYDLALLKLDRPAMAVQTGHARPACLPPPTHQLEPDLLCWVTGWGSLQEGGAKGDKEKKCQNHGRHFGNKKCLGMQDRMARLGTFGNVERIYQGWF